MGEILILVGIFLLFVFGSKFIKGVFESISALSRGAGWVSGPFIFIAIIILLLMIL